MRGALWYTWRDPANPVGLCGWCASAGLFDNDLDPKPAWRAYTELTGGEAGRGPGSVWPPAIAGRMTIVSSAPTAVLEAVEDADVLVVEIDVDVAVELAVVAEQLLLGPGVGGGEAAQNLAHLGALDADLDSPPVWARSTGGIFTVGIAAKTLQAWWSEPLARAQATAAPEQNAS